MWEKSNEWCVLGIKSSVGATQPRKDLKKEHYKKIYFSYIRLVKINSAKAQICAYSLIQVLCRSFKVFWLQTMETSSGCKQ